MLHGIRKASGMTFVELMFSLLMLIFILLATVAIYIAVMRMIERSRAESELFREGSHVMEMIQRGESGLHGLMKAQASSAAISPDGTQIDFLVDKNANYTETATDDVAMSIAFDNGDGDDGTLEDNFVAIDTDTSTTGNTLAIGSDVESLTFTANNEVITVGLTLTRSVRGSPISLSFSRDIWMRN